MTDREAFIASILASPGDDAPRLIYADWLDEQGECERAELIRVQIKAHRDPGWSGGVQREQDLLSGNWWQWFPVNLNMLICTNFPDPFHMEWIEGTPTCRFYRGFVGSLKISSEDWLTHADDIYSSQPVENIDLTGPLDWFCPDRKGTIVLSAERMNVQRACKIAKWNGIPNKAGTTVVQDVLAAEWPRTRFTLPHPFSVGRVNYTMFRELEASDAAMRLQVPISLIGEPSSANYSNSRPRGHT